MNKVSTYVQALVIVVATALFTVGAYSQAHNLLGSRAANCQRIWGPKCPTHRNGEFGQCPDKSACVWEEYGPWVATVDACAAHSAACKNASSASCNKKVRLSFECLTYFCMSSEGDSCRYETCINRYIGGTPLDQDCWGSPCTSPADGTINWGEIKVVSTETTTRS